MRIHGRVALCALVFGAFTLAVSQGCSERPGTLTGSAHGGASGSASSAANAGAGAGTSSAGNGGAGTSSVSASSGSGGAGGGIVLVQAPCQGHIYACGDTIDNDGDGLIDSQDPDCLGPCDNTESSYYGGIPGDTGPPCWVDCYFDQDSGSGNDDCYWNHACDPHEVPPGYSPESDNGATCAYDPNAKTPGTNKTCDELYQMQSNACLSYCGPLTPNGCDCFGCCELPAGTGKYVWLGSEQNKVGTCDAASVGDPTKCQPCLPVQACLNTCDHCELCVGKTTLPADCDSPDASSEPQCPPGIQACGLPGQPLCPVNSYCITGCCQKIIP